MFIHIGGDTMVSLRDVVGIFDVQAESSPDTAAFLAQYKKRVKAEIVEVGDVKSFVVTNEKLYYSPISSLTLKKRAEQEESMMKLETDSKD